MCQLMLWTHNPPESDKKIKLGIQREIQIHRETHHRYYDSVKACLCQKCIWEETNALGKGPDSGINWKGQIWIGNKIFQEN